MKQLRQILLVVAPTLLLFGLWQEDWSDRSEQDREQTTAANGERARLSKRNTISPPSAAGASLDIERSESLRPSSSPEACNERCGTNCTSEGLCPKECRSSSDCGRLEVCVLTAPPTALEEGLRAPPTGRCLENSCEEDLDCAVGEQCIRITREFRTIKTCSRFGERRLGEACMGGMGASRPPLVRTCGKGMTCAAVVCVSASGCSQDSDCSFGKCRAYEPGKLGCAPLCDHDGDCLPSQRCSVRAATAMCVPSETPVTCLESGCDQGKVCLPFMNHWLTPMATCVAPCERQADCPNGSYCLALPSAPGSGVDIVAGCLEICRSSGDCQDGFECTAFPGTKTAGCMPDPQRILRTVFDRYP